MIVELASLQKTESKVVLTDPEHLKPLSKMSKKNPGYLPKYSSAPAIQPCKLGMVLVVSLLSMLGYIAWLTLRDNKSP